MRRSATPWAAGEARPVLFWAYLAASMVLSATWTWAQAPAPAAAPAAAAAAAAAATDDEGEGGEGAKPVAPPKTPEERFIDSELRYASALAKSGFPDYTDKVLKPLTERYPLAQSRASAVRIEALTAWGKLDEAEKLIASMPSNSVETMSMRLALAAYYYAWGNLPKARQLYDAFFKQYPNGPPKEINTLYGEEAYKFAQMLIMKGDNKGALQAYRYVLLSKPEKEVESTIQTEMAELLLKMGEAVKDDATEREKYFKEARDFCNKVQWLGLSGGQPELFGKTIVMMAHMKVLEGKKDEARKIISDPTYIEILKQIDKAIRDQKLPAKLSPMPQCKYLLASLYEEDGRKLFETAGKEGEGIKFLELALGGFLTVFSKYPGSTWAPEAGRRYDDLRMYLIGKNRKIVAPPVDMKPIIEAQFKEAKLMFQDQRYKEAAEQYVEVLNFFPNKPGSVSAAGELAQCYVREDNPLFAKAVIGYIAERFNRDEALQAEAGTALLGIAAVYEEMGKSEELADTYSLFFNKFPTHEKASVVLFRMGNIKYVEERFGEAVEYFRKIVEQHKKARVYPESLSRLAYCQVKMNDYTNAINTLTNYVAELSPGPDKISATFRLADAYRTTDQIIPSLNEYARIINWLEKEGPKFSPTPDDIGKNRKVLEAAMFWKPFSYSRLKKPEDKIPEFQGRAIDGFYAFLKEFPKSTNLAPKALSMVGTLLYVQKKTDDASKVYEQLKRDFPESDEAKNAVYARGSTLLQLGRTDDAIKVFEEMFSNAKAFTPAQFYLVGKTMLESKQYPTAIRAFEHATAGEDRGVWEASRVELAKAHVVLTNWPAAAKPIEELLTKYTNTGFMVEGSFILSRAYAEIAQREADSVQRDLKFRDAIKWANKARRFSRGEPDIRARSDVEIAAVQILQGKKDDAIASYLRLILTGDPNMPKVRPQLEEAVHRVLPLLMEKEKFQDLLETTQYYLKNFPQGPYVREVRKFRDEMKMRGIQLPEDTTAEEEEAGAGGTTGAVTATNAPVATGGVTETNAPAMAPVAAPVATNAPAAGK